MPRGLQDQRICKPDRAECERESARGCEQVAPAAESFDRKVCNDTCFLSVEPAARAEQAHGNRDVDDSRAEPRDVESDVSRRDGGVDADLLDRELDVDP